MMSKSVRTILLFLSVLLLAYGAYDLNPIKNQDNMKSYALISAGFLSLILSLIKEKND